MTENEYKRLMEIVFDDCMITKEDADAITTIFEEIQQYRAIGLTPKMIKEMIESEKLASHAAIIRGAELELYQEIGSVEEFKDLKEKSVAKKPIRNDLCTCPSCGTYNEVIGKRRNTVAFDTVYCWHCGQAIEIKRD